MHNYRRIVRAFVALSLCITASAAQAADRECKDGNFRTYSWIDFGKCVRLRPNDPTNALTHIFLTKFTNTCSVRIDQIDTDGISGPNPIPSPDACEPVYDALETYDRLLVTKKQGERYLTILRNGTPRFTAQIEPVDIEFKSDGKKRRIGYRTKDFVAVKTTSPPIKTRYIQYYVYLSYARHGKGQIKYYTVEAFDRDAGEKCLAHRPNPNITEVVDCDLYAKDDPYDRHDGQNRSGGGGEPMPNQ